MSALQNVSRETIANLEEYAELIRKWSPAINLVAKSTLEDIQARHIVDSAELYPMLPSVSDHIIDMGSGGGLPGIVLAIIGKEANPRTKYSLMESDQRKAAFLRAVSIDLGLNVEVLAERIEAVDPREADVVTARALAPLSKLLGYVDRHLRQNGVALLQKGRGHLEEVALAREFWEFDLETIPTQADSGSVVLRITNLKGLPKDGS